MNNARFRRLISWLVVVTMTLTQAAEVAALTLASTPLAATTASSVRPNLMYVLDDSGSMAWEYTPDYINDSTTAADPNSLGGSVGDGLTAVISIGAVTAINPSDGSWSKVYSLGTPSVVIIGGGGTGASAVANVSTTTKKITSITITNGGSGYTSAPYAVLIGGMGNATWGMCWGTTANNAGGSPRDTTTSPTCTTSTQIPWATSAINYQYYDPVVRYEAPLRADNTRYPNANPSAAVCDGFGAPSSAACASAGTTRNLTTGWPHEVWCNSSTANPSAADPTAGGKCVENSDTTNNTLYPNAAYTFRKTYNGPASYYTMSPTEYCTDDTLTSCVPGTTGQVIAGVTYNVPAQYRWCSYYNPQAKSFGGCQGWRDWSHYVPNYLGGWITSGSAGLPATATLTVNAVANGQSINNIRVDGVPLMSGAVTATAASTTTGIASQICAAVQANATSTGYNCAVAGSNVTLQSVVYGNLLPAPGVLVDVPTDAAAIYATGKITVTSPTTPGFQISQITLNGNPLIASTITAVVDTGLTAQSICQAINSGPNASGYVARSGDLADLSLNFGTCNAHATGVIEVQRKSADTLDNGFDFVMTGPTGSAGTITVNTTGGNTVVNDITLDGVSILTAKPLHYPNGAGILNGTETAAIAADIASKISTAGCTTSVTANTINLSGTCIGTLAASATGVSATGTFRVSSTGHTYGASLGGVQAGTAGIIGTVTSSQITNGTLTTTNAATLRTLINNATSVASGGVGPHGFTAAVSGSDVIVTAPPGSSYNNQSFNFLDGTSSASGAGSSPRWNFSITNATADDATISVGQCGATSIISGSASTGSTANNLPYVANLASGLNANGINGYSYSCNYVGGTANDHLCHVTGPGTCTGDLVVTKDGTITTKSYSKNAALAPQWKIEIYRTNLNNNNDSYINSITCGGTNTVTTNNVHTGTSTTADTRRNNVASGLNSASRNSYSYSCNSDTSANRVYCTVTGPTAPAACASLNITANSNYEFIDAGTMSRDYSPASWDITLDNATTANKLITSITCGGTNTITTSTVTTGAAGSEVAQRINNLTAGLASNQTAGYSFSCSAATTGTPSSTCQVTGPIGPASCAANLYATNDCPAGRLRLRYESTNTLAATGGNYPDTSGGTYTMCVPLATDGTAGGTAVDNFAPYLSTVSAFAGGFAGQSLAVAGMLGSGTIATSTVAMANGTAVSANAINITPLTTILSGGQNPDTTTNRWTGVGRFRRVDIVSSTGSYNRSSGRTDCLAATCTYAEEIQNFANWYSYYRTRTNTMKSATTLTFGPLDGNYRIGFDNICQATGTTVKLPVAQFVTSGGETGHATHKTSWWTQLANSDPSCATPLRAEAAKIGRYYAGKLTTSGDPLLLSCQQNFLLLVTDGYWNENEPSGTSITGGDIGNVDNVAALGRPYYDGVQPSTTCPATGTGRGANNSSCRTMADIAQYYYDTDLRTTALGNATNPSGVDVATNNVLTTADDKKLTQHMTFYAMGLGVDGTLRYRPDYLTAGTGAFAEIRAGTRQWPAVANLDPTAVDDLWHATANGRGKYFSARNVPGVVAGLREALTRIGGRVGSAAAAATSNLEPVAGDNFAYVASYATLDWVGDLQSRSIDVNTGEVSPDTNCSTTGSGCQWSAQSKLDQMTWSARRIYLQPTSGVSGDPLRAFLWDNLTGAEQAFFDPTTLTQYGALSLSNPADITAEKLTNFLRGDRGLEQDGNTIHPQIWRHRAHVLGDVVNTQPVFMKKPNRLYNDAGYAAFKTTSTAAARQPVVFVSSQDGMMHAINAHTAAVTMAGNTVQPGEELWAYVPSQSLAIMRVLADLNYTTGHRYFVDGPITIADVNFGTDDNDWHTILIGGQGAGGSSYFAIDVTNPLDPKFLWEFTDPNLGNTFSNPTVSKLPNGEWAVFFSSGYNNGGGLGHLYAINPKTGAIKSGFPLGTLSGGPSNLGKIAVWATNPTYNNTAEYVYAGDTNGDVWRFDLDHLATGHSGTDVFKLAHLEDGGVSQPITTKPELTTAPNGVRLIFVGTGKYLETSDLTNNDPQSFYAIKDTLGAPNLGGVSQQTWTPQTDIITVASVPVAAFLQRKLIADDDNGDPIVDAGGRRYRKMCAGGSSTVTSAGVCANEDPTVMDWDIYGGWFVNLPDQRERMNVDMKLVQGTLVFATNIPTSSDCTVGGRSWVNYLNYETGLTIDGATYASVQIPDSLVVGITVVKLQGGDFKTIVTKSNYQQETLTVPLAPTIVSPPTFQNKRNLWREFEAF